MTGNRKQIGRNLKKETKLCDKINKYIKKIVFEGFVFCIRLFVQFIFPRTSWFLDKKGKFWVLLRMTSHLLSLSFIIGFTESSMK